MKQTSHAPEMLQPGGIHGYSPRSLALKMSKDSSEDTSDANRTQIEITSMTRGNTLSGPLRAKAGLSGVRSVMVRSGLWWSKLHSQATTLGPRGMKDKKIEKEF